MTKIVRNWIDFHEKILQIDTLIINDTLCLFQVDHFIINILYGKFKTKIEKIVDISTMDHWCIYVYDSKEDCFPSEWII